MSAGRVRPSSPHSVPSGRRSRGRGLEELASGSWGGELGGLRRKRATRAALVSSGSVLSVLCRALLPGGDSGRDTEDILRFGTIGLGPDRGNSTILASPVASSPSPSSFPPSPSPRAPSSPSPPSALSRLLSALRVLDSRLGGTTLPWCTRALDSAGESFRENSDVECRANAQITWCKLNIRPQLTSPALSALILTHVICRSRYTAFLRSTLSHSACGRASRRTHVTCSALRVCFPQLGVWCSGLRRSQMYAQSVCPATAKRWGVRGDTLSE